MGLDNLEQIPILGHSKRTGLNDIDEKCPTETNLDAYQMHGNPHKFLVTHRSARECTGNKNNVQQRPSRMPNK